MKHDPLSKHGSHSKGLLMVAYFFLCERIVMSVRQKCSDPVYKVSQLITWSSPFPWQQEQLLLSVLPRYIAMELKTEVIKRLSKPTSKEEKESSFHNFHSLYIRQHKDVRWRSYFVEVMLNNLSLRYSCLDVKLSLSFLLPMNFLLVKGLFVITS